mmetsp:Transcript_4410/g.10667  ORF Transcript_4410/g.10667 Transcript_4410/m.10667 type:complete len:312 (+) Transcript_4410:356-1291(+)
MFRVDVAHPVQVWSARVFADKLPRGSPVRATRVWGPGGRGRRCRRADRVPQLSQTRMSEHTEPRLEVAVTRHQLPEPSSPRLPPPKEVGHGVVPLHVQLASWDRGQVMLLQTPWLCVCVSCDVAHHLVLQRAWGSVRGDSCDLNARDEAGISFSQNAKDRIRLADGPDELRAPALADDIRTVPALGLEGVAVGAEDVAAGGVEHGMVVVEAFDEREVLEHARVGAVVWRGPTLRRGFRQHLLENELEKQRARPCVLHARGHAIAAEQAVVVGKVAELQRRDFPRVQRPLVHAEVRKRALPARIELPVGGAD